MADAPWQLALLGAIFLTDAIVFIGLCRDEIEDWRGQRRAQARNTLRDGLHDPHTRRLRMR